MSSQVPVLRADFLDAMSRRIDAARVEESTLGLALIDIRQFHRINRLFGYRAGDRVLEAVRDALSDFGSKNPLLMRIGNDEFGMLFPGLANPSLLQAIASKITRLAKQSVEVDGHSIQVDANVGLAYYPGGASSPDELLSRAEQALRQARELDQAHRFYEADEQGSSSDDWLLDVDLQQAIKEQQLSLAYLPLLDLRSGQVSRAEALLRWQHPEHGSISPDRVLPLLEQSGKIGELTRWTLNTALRESRQWPIDDAERVVAVNLAPGAFLDEQLVESVTAALRLWGQEASNLSLEITEEVVMSGIERQRRDIDAIRELGVHVSVDDFGTGQSTLSRFKSLPASELKIDKVFIDGLPDDRDDLRIVRHVVGLAHAFRLQVVAEGVEDEPSLALVRKLGCDHAQGYCLARPMPQREFIAWLKARANA